MSQVPLLFLACFRHQAARLGAHALIFERNRVERVIKKKIIQQNKSPHCATQYIYGKHSFRTMFDLKREYNNFIGKQTQNENGIFCWKSNHMQCSCVDNKMMFIECHRLINF